MSENNEKKSKLAQKLRTDDDTLRSFATMAVTGAASYNVSATVMEAGHEEPLRQVTVVDQGGIQTNDGDVVPATIVKDELGRTTMLVDIDKDGLADVQLTDVDGDGKFGPDEGFDLTGLGMSMTEPDANVIYDNLDMLAHDRSLPDYVNDGDIQPFETV